MSHSLNLTNTGRRLSQWLFYVILMSALLCEPSKCNGESASQQTSHFSAYEVTVPKRITRQRRDLDGQDTGQVFYAIQTQGKEHILVLERNTLLLPEDFTVFTYHKNGSLITQRPNMQNHCYYRGYVKDMEGSSASLSLCSGLNGRLVIGNSTFGIEPLDGSSDFEHVVYRLEDEETELLSYGTTHAHRHDDQTVEHTRNDFVKQPLKHLHRSKRAIMQQTHYVELMLVVDVERMYAQLNIRVVLVGLEIWTAGNPISLDGTNQQILHRFVNWRKQYLLPRQPHDSAQLIIKKFLRSKQAAYLNGVCSPDIGGGVNMFLKNDVAYLAFVVSHGLGHNLGMRHLSHRNCRCPGKTCIMNSTSDRSTSFSSCSSDDFEMMVQQMQHNCLLNMPKPHKAFSKPACGNKLLDPGEECDCGSEEECEKDPCCEPKTCKLKSWAQCAYGECCRNCKFLASGYECRSQSDECDLPEYCNGSSPVCQADVFLQNGHLCRNSQSYCYNGKCRHHDSQCQTLFGSQAKSAADECFELLNSKGDRFGNCGYNIVKCEKRNAMCGKLQCENVRSRKVFGIEPDISSTSFGSHTCWGVDLRLGLDVPDPIMVNDGTKCGENQVCIDYRCRNVSMLNYDCDAEKQCHGHGVCNSNKNCHCDYGWAPPFCEEEGYGGSIDSGPAYNDITSREGLLVLYCLVLPLLCLGLIVYYKRNELQQHLCRKRSPQDNREPQASNQLPTDWEETQRSAVNNEVVKPSETASAFSYTQYLPESPFRSSLAVTQGVPQRPHPQPPV
ncbi:disintegrin and metalloproteinase domain-containing protein 9-like isoform X2 [Clupea harengus]|uniref:Disintegrin and metalloproteinase domain-containing protein 9-like isoform X2 n=1 Tax=Clupea harengus TaxID=7950 RepID=A0A6P8FJP4_CLUHA|nr:disintegrin and metalloproteinase domain-containing protein 9-like isoform X2 [Clupea harengus]